VSGTICGKKITETNIKNLLAKGTTGKINGFKSKTGKSFSAAIKLIDGKTEFEF
jgi:DNA topoisomerase-3